MSTMLIMSCYTGFVNVRRGWQSLNTGPRLYLRLIRRKVGCEVIHPAQPTDAPSSAEVLGPISIARCCRRVDPFQKTSASRAESLGAYSLGGGSTSDVRRITV